MLMVAKKYLLFVIHAVRMNMKVALTYKLNFGIQVIFMIINNSFFLVFWKVLFHITGPNTDIHFNMILYLWSFACIAYGISYFFFDGIRHLSQYIITGGLDSYLLQPKNIYLNIMASKSDFSACGDIIYGLIIGGIASQGNLSTFCMVMVFGMFGSIFFIATEMIIGSLSVWISNTEKIGRKYINTLITTFTNYPEQIFGGGVKFLLYSIVPAGYISQLPLRLVLHFSWTELLWFIGMGVIYLMTSVIIFQKAIRSYASGNMISMKM